MQMLLVGTGSSRRYLHAQHFPSTGSFLLLGLGCSANDPTPNPGIDFTTGSGSRCHYRDSGGTNGPARAGQRRHYSARRRARAAPSPGSCPVVVGCVVKTTGAEL